MCRQSRNKIPLKGNYLGLQAVFYNHTTFQEEKKVTERNEMQAGRYAGLDSGPICTDFSSYSTAQDMRIFSSKS